MGVQKVLGSVSRHILPAIVVWPLLVGCQMGPMPSKAELLEVREAVDETGLGLPMAVKEVNVNAALPSGWLSLGIQKAAMYTHTQWRSPSKRTAVGSTYVKMPLPISTKTLVWFAMNEAGKRTKGQIIRQWTDELGREWFEAENTKYRMTGYVMTRGFDAWINYYGYRIAEPKQDEEVGAAERSLNTFMPLSVVGAPKMQSASAE